MEDLESQIAKITLGNFRQTNSFVYVLAEKAVGSPAELYLIVELPLLNPAASESCQQICLSIASTLKRVYRKPLGEETFENAIAQINEELGKLASLGQTHWINKLNCIIAVKNNNNLTITTCGKVAAFLLRKIEFTDISCSAAHSHPLKTFENFATGKIRLNDLILFSTSQLFNYLSIDRLKNILAQSDFLTATQAIIELLKQNAEPQVAFGVLLNLQIPPGQSKDEEIDLESYVIEKPMTVGFWDKITSFFMALFALDHSRRIPKISLPKISLPRQLITGGTKTLTAKGKNLWNALGKGLTASKGALNLQNFKNFAPQKKFFFISAFILLLAFLVNVGVAVHYKKVKIEREQIIQNLGQTQKLLANAQTSLLYDDKKTAINSLQEAENKLPRADKLSEAQKGLYNQTLNQINILKQKLEGVTEAKVNLLGNLSSSDNLIKLPKYLATQINNNVISYDKETGQIQDGKIQLPENIISTAYTKDDRLVIYNGSSLLVWDANKNKAGQQFSAFLPEKNAFVGLKYFPAKDKVYVINKASKQAVSFLINNDQISKPVIAIKDKAELEQAVDFAIDGSIYVLTSTSIKKFLNGNLVEFNFPFLFKPLSGKGKIYTEAGLKYIYLLDSGNNRILIFDKKGNLAYTLINSQFTKMVDFEVDEKNKTIYVLNDSSLLKVNY